MKEKYRYIMIAVQGARLFLYEDFHENRSGRFITSHAKAKESGKSAHYAKQRA